MTCTWCDGEIGQNGLQPWDGVWVHRRCDNWAWHEATPEELGRYLDKVKPS